jgi:hypothetical protein
VRGGLAPLLHITAQPTQSEALRLLALDQREERARQHRVRVPLDAGPWETHFRRVLALLLRESPDATGRASLSPTSPAREALFAARVQLAASEAALSGWRLPAP